MSMEDDVHMQDVDKPDQKAVPAPAAAAAAGPSDSCRPELPWLEKFRPKVIGDIVGNVEAVGRLQIIAEEGNMPNLILAVRPYPQEAASH